ncbi:hypothetical protein [Parapedobacter tibetensis]|uniref:hypothetical protein n=1 Tax=Parapedobacter tibetensis TaxID=2972951 RepID=UPI00214D7C5B|nr:hypothetical protein [Parapedobacter tibetensis]
MKRFFRSIIFFCLFASVIYCILIIIFGDWSLPYKNLGYRIGSHGHLFSRLKEAEKAENVDLLIIGSSHAYRGYDVRLFTQKGIKAFNLGSSAQSPIQTQYLFNKYVKILRPKLVILDIYPKVLCIDGVESTLDLLSNARELDRELIKMALKTMDISAYNTLIYTMYRKYLGLDHEFQEQVIRRGDKYISRGYVETYDYSPKVDSTTKSFYTVLPDQLEAFEQLISTFKDKNIPYILVQTPIRETLYSSVLNQDKIDKLINRYGTYLNYAQFPIDDNYFLDDSHLNQKGVDIFNDHLIRTLKNKGFLDGLYSK